MNSSLTSKSVLLTRKNREEPLIYDLIQYIEYQYWFQSRNIVWSQVTSSFPYPPQFLSDPGISFDSNPPEYSQLMLGYFGSAVDSIINRIFETSLVVSQCRNKLSPKDKTVILEKEKNHQSFLYICTHIDDHGQILITTEHVKTDICYIVAQHNDRLIVINHDDVEVIL